MFGDFQITCYHGSTCADLQIDHVAVHTSLLLLHQYVVLWTGSLQEIYSDSRLLQFCCRSCGSVIIGTGLPRFSFLPLSCPVWLNTFSEYITPTDNGHTYFDPSLQHRAFDASKHLNRESHTNQLLGEDDIGTGRFPHCIRHHS